MPAVRPCRASDLRGIRNAQALYHANQPETFLSSYSSLRHGIRSLWPLPRERPRMFVAHEHHQLAGFADFCPIGPDLRWQLVAVGLTPGGQRGRAAEALLRFGATTAGEDGVKRLYASLPLDSLLMDDVHAVGFHPYAEEDILLVDRLPQKRMPLALRPQEQADTWAIHQLYNAAVPRQVQYAEAYTSHVWDITVRRRSAADTRCWVVEDGHQLAGYLRIASRREWHVIDVVVSPERPDVLATLLTGTAAYIGSRPGRRIFATVPTYQQHHLAEFEAIGFKHGWRQQRHVKYTTVTARAPMAETVLTPVDARERVTKRVPTFMHSPRHEEPVPPSR